MNANFKYDFVKNTIVASKAALRKASDPASKEYKELMAMMERQPTFRVVEREIKKSSNKTTYKGLTTQVMRDYIGSDDEKKKELDKALEIGGYPMAKQWFLSTYEKPTMADINTKVTQGRIAKIRVKTGSKVTQLPTASNQ